MKSLRSLIALVLSVVLLVGAVPFSQAAAADTIQLDLTYINPLYDDILTEADLNSTSLSNSHRVLFSKPEYMTDLQQAASFVRNVLKNRQETFTLYFQNNADSPDTATADIQQKISQISDLAMIHTGIPTEGDYLMWQFAGWKVENATGSYEGNTYYWEIPFRFTYYTTLEEEQMVDTAVQNVLNQLNVSDATDYEKIRSIYDYICANVTYDYNHLGDISYTRQFTAYAALIDGTSVCQGYAVLLYRLALELGVDARLIPGTSKNQNHGWNIAKLGDLYYHLDATWDAGQDTHTYFLKGADFPDHIRDAEYDTSDFHAEYPVSPTDYIPGSPESCTHNYFNSLTTPATCTANGMTTYVCAFCNTSYTETIPATGHIFGDWSVSTAPTCVDPGTDIRSCACGASETRTVDATGHSWDDGVIQQQEGIRLYTCSVCLATKTEPLPAAAVVSRVYGDNRYRTAFAAADMLKEIHGVDRFETIVVACGTDFADALSGSYLANKKNAPILLVHKNSVEYVAEYIVHNLAENGLIYILGGEGAVPPALDDVLSNQSISVKRLAGQGRYETNLLILQEAGVGDEPILISTGKNFADCLSASATGLPILLTNNIALKDSQKEFLASLNGNRRYIIGGEAAVSEAIASEIGACTRICGSGRYETSIKIAETFFDAPNAAVLAYGGNFPDGLSGGCLAYAMNAPLILVRDTTTSYAAAYTRNHSITSGVVLGGDGLIGNSTVTMLFQMQ